MRRVLMIGAAISVVTITAVTLDSARAEVCLLDGEGNGGSTDNPDGASLACGVIAKASGDESVAIGIAVAARGEKSTAIGRDSEANGTQSLALGNEVLASGSYASAIGAGARAGHNSSVLGYNASATDQSVAIGGNATVNETNSIAIGANTTVDSGGSVVVGDWASTSGSRSIALGALAKATADYSVAIGALSVADQADTVSFGSAIERNINGDTVIDPGEGLIQRRLVNVADGIAASDVATVGQVDGKIATFEQAFLASGDIESTVEGAQFFTELTGRVDTVESDITGLRNGVNSHTANIANNAAGIATNTTAIDGLTGRVDSVESEITGLRSDVDSHTAGVAANITGITTNRTDIATNRTGIATNTTAIDGLIGRVDTAESDITSLKAHFGTIDRGVSNSLALGAGSVAQSSNTVSFGRAESSPGAGDAYARRLTNIADGIDPSDAATMGQLTALNGTVASVEGQVNQLFDLAAVDRKDTRQGLAAVAAMADPHFPSEVGKTSYASNVATHRGEFGISAGLMHRIKGNFAITAGATYAGGDSATFRGGVAGEF